MAIKEDDKDDTKATNNQEIPPYLNQKQSQSFRSRKFYMLCGLVSISSGFLCIRRMSAEEWINFNRWIFGIYAAGNVTTKAADAWKQNGCQNPLSSIIEFGQYQQSYQQPHQQMQMAMPTPTPYQYTTHNGYNGYMPQNPQTFGKIFSDVTNDLNDFDQQMSQFDHPPQNQMDKMHGLPPQYYNGQQMTPHHWRMMQPETKRSRPLDPMSAVPEK